MLTIEVTTPIGRLTLRRVVEESYQHLYPLVSEGFQVKTGAALLDAQGGIRVRVDCCTWGPYPRQPFWITLSPAVIADLDEADFLAHLTLQFVECLPEPVRARCTEALDFWAVQLDLPTRAELLTRLVPPIVETVKPPRQPKPQPCSATPLVEATQ